MQVTDAAQIPSGCGCGQQLQLLIRPLAREPPYAADVALKRQKKKKKKSAHSMSASDGLRLAGVVAMAMHNYHGATRNGTDGPVTSH